MLVGLVPFAALGILVGHLFTADSVGPVIGGGVALLAILGGTWFPITGGVMLDIAQALPSYWLVQASHVALGGASWGARGWLVVGVWTVAATALAAPRLPARHEAGLARVRRLLAHHDRRPGHEERNV